MSSPAAEEIRALHERHAPSLEAFEAVYSHSEIVWRIAEELLNSRNDTDIDRDLVRAGSLLHDIGVYRLYGTDGNLDHKKYVRHGLLGHEILAAEGLPETLCRFCSCHTGVGLTRDDVLCQQLPLPPADYLAITEEEKLVMYADKLHSKTTPPKFLTANAYAAYVSRFGHDKVDAFTLLRKTFGEPDVHALAAFYGQALTE
ncbi:HD domain-containing protein [Streptomyces fradiae]|uniref:HD domain-containing protein n=1 Tax=Streptomyces fradiae TaxID=1906 RepID=UPI0036A08D28